MKSKVFWISVVLSVLLYVGLFKGVLSYLEGVTMHNETIEVPDFSGLKGETEMAAMATQHDLEYIIVDSVFDPKKPRGSVLDQNPEAGDQVKSGRKIYLTINTNSPPRVSVPQLKDLSLRQAMAIVETYGLKVDSLQYVPSECVGCVVGIMQKGRNLSEGDFVSKGSAVVLLMGAGASDEMIPVPILIGMDRSTVDVLLKSKGLNLGFAMYEDCQTAEDSANAKVFNQVPNYGAEEYINLGKTINVFLTANPDKIPTIEVDASMEADEN